MNYLHLRTRQPLVTYRGLFSLLFCRAREREKRSWVGHTQPIYFPLFHKWLSSELQTMDLLVAYKFILLATSIALVSCEICEPVTIESCSSAGYRLTARFPDVDGQPYQDVQASRLGIYIPLLQTCSEFASTILCSLYVPKCEEGRKKPWIPCRKVCTKFVGDCFRLLPKAGLTGMFTALCDLLPDDKNPSQNCFYPPNFPNTTSVGEFSGIWSICLLAKVSYIINLIKFCIIM